MSKYSYIGTTAAPTRVTAKVYSRLRCREPEMMMLVLLILTSNQQSAVPSLVMIQSAVSNFI